MLIRAASRRRRSTAALAARASRSARSASVSDWSISSRRIRPSARASRNALASSADPNGSPSARHTSERRIIGWHPEASSRARAKNASQAASPPSCRALRARKASLAGGIIVASIGSKPSIRPIRYRSSASKRRPPSKAPRSRIQVRSSQARPSRESSSSATIRLAPSDGSSSSVDSSHASSRPDSSAARAADPDRAASRLSSARRTARSRYAASARSASSIFADSSAAFLSSLASSWSPAEIAAPRNLATRSWMPRGSASRTLGPSASRRLPPGP
ncbi:hypothetical protein [Aquisphaera giovannonii]|uniref:hypothetical protein n=1 Tax=Aquisphaera giovannonii TaxID=406548 RepID=UPI0011E0345D|nr:hypothetical protein [Aquisphaera giovannonii]